MNLIALLPQLEQEFLVKDSFGVYEITYGTTALTRLARLFADEVPTGAEIEAFLLHLNTRYPRKDREELAERMISFLSEFIELLFSEPMWAEDGIENHEAMMLNTFVGYWTLLSHLNQFKNFMPEDVAQKDILLRFLHRTKPYKPNLAYQDLERANLSYLVLDSPNFYFANLKKASLLYAQLPNAVFDNATLQGAQASHAYLPEGSWIGANLADAHFLEAELRKGIWHKANLAKADFTQASLQESFLDLSDLQDADFTMANLRQCHLFLSDVRFANFTKAHLAYAKMTNVDMREANLYRANFQYAELIEVILQPKTFEKADFRFAVLGERNQDFLQKQGAIIN